MAVITTNKKTYLVTGIHVNYQTWILKHHCFPSVSGSSRCPRLPGSSSRGEACPTRGFLSVSRPPSVHRCSSDFTASGVDQPGDRPRDARPPFLGLNFQEPLEGQAFCPRSFSFCLGGQDWRRPSAPI